MTGRLVGFQPPRGPISIIPKGSVVKTNYVVNSQVVFEPGDIVTVTDSVFWRGRVGIVIAHALDVNEVAVDMEYMVTWTKLIFIHGKRLKKVG